MNQIARFESANDSRISLFETSITRVPFQLLPRATYPAKQIEEGAVWQAEFSRTLAFQPKCRIVILPGVCRESSSIVAVQSVFESLAVQTYRNFDVVYVSEVAGAAEDAAVDQFKSLELSGQILRLNNKIEQDASELFALGADCDLLIMIAESQILHPYALFALAREVTAGESLLYANEVTVDSDYGALRFFRRAPVDKYSALSFDPVGSFFCCTSGLATQLAASNVCAGFSPEVWGWRVATFCNCDNRVRLVPLALCVRVVNPVRALNCAKAACAEKIARDYAVTLGCNITSAVVEIHGCSDIVVRPRLQSLPARIQVIVPFYNKSDLTVRCLASLALQDCIEDLEITLVDNKSDVSERKQVDKAVRDYSLSERTTVLDDGDYFNFARLNNVATRVSDSDFILFLNNDVELSQPDAISELRFWLAQSDVAAVGGQLKYEDGRIQHGGINFSSIRPENVVSEDQFSFATREVNALSFAFALVRRDVFTSIGMLDEESCPNGFGDALLGARIRNAGYRIIYNPWAVAIHRESASRGRCPEEYEMYEMHQAGIPIADLYGDMDAVSQPTRLVLADIDEPPVMQLMQRIRRIGWLYALANSVSKFVLYICSRRSL